MIAMMCMCMLRQQEDGGMGARFPTFYISFDAGPALHDLHSNVCIEFSVSSSSFPQLR